VKLHFGRIKNTSELGRDSSNADFNMDDENLCLWFPYNGAFEIRNIFTIFLSHIFILMKGGVLELLQSLIVLHFSEWGLYDCFSLLVTAVSF
jgi:hypothetical protein